MHSFAQKRVGAGAEVDWPGIFRAFVIAFVMTGLPIFLHIWSQAGAIVLCAVLAIIVTRAFEQDAPIIILVANVFQNIFAALVSPQFSEYSEIEILKSYSFVTTVACYLSVAYGFLTATATFSTFIQRLIYASMAVLLVVGVYFVLGLAINPRNATVYFRNIGLPIIFFQIFLVVSAKHRLPMPQIALVLLSLVMVCSYFELFWIEGWLSLTNGWTYLNLFTAKRLTNLDEIRVAKESGAVIANVLDYSRATLLNTTLTQDLGLYVQRLIGPNFNTISIAYFLAIFISFLLLHGYWLTALLAAPLLIATSAKGPTALAIGCAIFFYFARKRNSNAPVIGLAISLIVYAIFVFQSGYRSGDFHVLGLLGGVNGFFSMPIGHTLGDGGNLSIPDFSTLRWGDFQRAGAASVAVESAFGVLLFQMGVAAAVPIVFYLWVARISWRLYGPTGAPSLAFATSAILICLVNGLFQEDAYFVPLSLPVLMGLVGASLGAADRVLAPRLDSLLSSGSQAGRARSHDARHGTRRAKVEAGFPGRPRSTI